MKTTMTPLLIKNGQIVTPSTIYKAHLLIEAGQIKTISTDIEPVKPGTKVIDATGFYILPGGIDAHVHMELPVGNGIISSDDFETGSRAALAGGTTTIIDFVTPQPGQSLIDATTERKKNAEKSLCDYSLHLSVTHWHDQIPQQLKLCAEKFGISSVKLYMAYKQTIGLDDSAILKVMAAAARLHLLVMMHCENGDAVTFLQDQFIREGKRSPMYHPLSRPPLVEAEAVKRAMMMAHITQCPLYIVHVSTQDAIEEIQRARALGHFPPILAETCPHYLLLDDSCYQRPGFQAAAFVMSPPLRPRHHKNSLWNAIGNNLIQTIATDHCPFHMKNQKETGRDDFTRIPNGVAGIEHRLELLYSYGVLENHLTLPNWVNITTTNPAKIFGLYPRKGIIQPGSDADLVLWNPEIQEFISANTHYQRCDTTIYEGFKIKGKPHTVILGGRIVFQNGAFLPHTGNGHFLSREHYQTVST